MRLEQCLLSGGGSLTVYLREAFEAMPNAQQRPMVLVVPGGGYRYVSPREADPVALQFAAAGYHTAILDYGVDENARDYLPLRQISEALGLIRARAQEWNVLDGKVAACGFSAGAHLALSSAVLSLPDAQQAAQQNRPDALILAYPVVTAGEYAHRGSFNYLAGTEDIAAQQAFTLEDKVTPQTPPTFVWHTMDDRSVPVENSLLLLNALHRNGVSCEAHLYQTGAHGSSISTVEVDAPDAHRNSWVRLAIEWLGQTFAFHL